MTQPQTREYASAADSTGTFGRVMCSVREHLFIADGPVHNGCPGVAITPAEMFLASVAACAVELIQVIARDRDVAIGNVETEIRGVASAPKTDREFTTFESVHLRVNVEGASQKEALELVKAFKGR